MSTLQSSVTPPSDKRVSSYLTDHNYFGGWLALFVAGLLLSNVISFLRYGSAIALSETGQIDVWIGLSAAKSLTGLLLTPVLLFRWQSGPTLARVYLVCAFLVDFLIALFLQTPFLVLLDFLLSYLWLVYFTDSKRVQTYYHINKRVRA